MPPPEQRRPFPDEAHEALAGWVEETLADVRSNQVGVGDAYLLTDVLFALLDGLLTQNADLTARVTALEPVPPAPTDPEEPAP